MARPSAASVGQLRALTYRISSTNSTQLPTVVSQISGAIWTCKDLLSLPDDSQTAGDASTSIRRLRTQLSTLLQDRAVEGRWSAVVLVKAVVEAGGLEVIRKSNAWVKNLLAILKKPDPPTTHVLSIVVLTRMFMLTWDHSELVREITTPALPTFISSCLAVANRKIPSASELLTVLESFNTLLARHPTVFRTYESDIRSLLRKILSGPSNGFHPTTLHQAAARRLWAVLPFCAPKQGGADRWQSELTGVVRAAHATADCVFRSIQEDWQPKSGASQPPQAKQSLSGEMTLQNDEHVGLSGWIGLYDGTERLTSLLRLLRSYVESATPSAVTLRIGLFVDLWTRLSTITAPARGNENGVRPNPQISKDEREAMFSVLPAIHSAVLELHLALLARLECCSLPICQSLLEDTIRIFEAEQADDHVRLGAYQVLSALLHLVGPTMLRTDVIELGSMIRACCRDLLPDDGASQIRSMRHDPAAARAHGAPRLSQRGAFGAPGAGFELEQAAGDLLQAVYQRLDASHMPPKLRALMDRVVVLTRDKTGILASVLNPARKHNDKCADASLLPVLTNQFMRAPEVEALLRPRLPPIRIAAAGSAPETTSDLAEDEGSDTDNAEGVLGVRSDHADVSPSRPPADGADGTSEDLYSATPIHHSPALSRSPHRPMEEEQTNGKRKMEEAADTKLLPKRLRASPTFTTAVMTPYAQGSLLSVSSVVTDDGEAAQTGAPQATSDLQQIDANPVLQTDKNGYTGATSDDSDFEMPPLTMESDTDSDDGNGEEGSLGVGSP